MSTPSGPIRAAFRLPRSAYFAVLFFGLGMTALVRHPVLVVLYIFPILAALFIARRGTFVDRDTITVRAVFGRRVVAWKEVRGLVVDEHDRLAAALPDGTALRLPYVRVRHLGVLSQITGGTVPALPAIEVAEPAGEDPQR